MSVTSSLHALVLPVVVAVARRIGVHRWQLGMGRQDACQRQHQRGHDRLHNARQDHGQQSPFLIGIFGFYARWRNLIVKPQKESIK
ncbi:hypothetical protein AB2N08_02840 [Massilia aurea]|uniref:hypothetical protein n=1 Tax=Massilia aurea TaxID=373040 RepID=UPI003462D2FF